MLVRFSEGTLASIDRTSEPGESRAAFVRVAVMKEVESRERRIRGRCEDEE